MKAGANYLIVVTVNTVGGVDKIIFTLKGKSTLTKVYPDNVSYSNGKYLIPLTQEDTLILAGNVQIEAQINYTDKSVAKTSLSTIHISETLATEMVAGNTPSGTNLSDVTLSIDGNVIIASITGDISDEAGASTWDDITNKPFETLDSSTLSVVNGALKVVGGGNVATIPDPLQVSHIETGDAGDSYFQARRFRGEGNASSYYHAVDFGYAGHDTVDFYEYAGVYTFNQCITGAKEGATEVFKISPEGLFFKGDKISGASTSEEAVLFQITGGKIIGTDGTINDNFNRGGCTTSEQFIPVAYGDEYVYTGGGIWSDYPSGVNPIVGAWYNSDKEFVSVAINNVNCNNLHITVPNGVAYLGINYWNGATTSLRKLVETKAEVDKDFHLAQMRAEQSRQRKSLTPYFKTPSTGMITFGIDDLAVGDTPKIIQKYCEANIPIFASYTGNYLYTFSNVDADFWGSSYVTVKECIDKIIEYGGEVLAHHDTPLTEAMLNDYETCKQHFIDVKNQINGLGWDCDGCILAGGTGQVVGSEKSDMWVRSNFLYSDLYGVESAGAPYYHRRSNFSNYANVSAIKTAITNAINGGQWLVLYQHNFSELLESDLAELLAWINQQNIKPCTYAEVYNTLIDYKVNGVSITQGGGSTPTDPDDTPDEPTSDWDDETTITRAWATSEGVFNNLNIDTTQFTAGTTVPISCTVNVESTASSGEVIFRIAGATYNAGTINFNQDVEISGTMNANSSWEQAQKLSVYTTNGSGFPWTVKVKDVSLG